MNIPQERVEILRLRARIVALEKMSMAALELVLRIRPEELRDSIEVARRRLAIDYSSPEFAEDIVHPEERQFLAREVERLMRGLQSDLGFRGGIATLEKG